jgi:hypothetical protein
MSIQEVRDRMRADMVRIEGELESHLRNRKEYADSLASFRAKKATGLYAIAWIRAEEARYRNWFLTLESEYSTVQLNELAPMGWPQRTA